MSKTKGPDSPADDAAGGDRLVPRAIAEGAWARTLRRKLLSGTQAFASVTTEPRDVERAVTHVATKIGGGIPTITWDCADGFAAHGLDPDALGREVARLSQPPSPAEPEGTGDPGLLGPLAALQAILRLRLPGDCNESAIFVLHNFFGYFGDAVVAQTFENLVKNALLSRNVKSGGRSFIRRRPIYFVQSPHQKLDLKGITTVQHWIADMPFPLPDVDELREEQVEVLVADLKRKEAAGTAKRANIFEERYLAGVAAACRGLSRQQATETLFYAAAVHGGLTEKVPAAVRAEAAKLLAATNTLEIVDPARITPPEQLGGIGRAVKVLERAARTFTEEARAEHLDPARGCWYAGMPGTGKSELSKTAGLVFERVTKRAFTVLRVRVDALFGGVVGETQANWRDVEGRIAAFGPDTIVWLDELDKAFGGVADGGGDSGIRLELFGQMLTWLSDPARACFVQAAMNDIAGIPGELFRRFDHGFFFDLPGRQARRDIARIHFAKRLRRGGLGLEALGYTEPQWDEVADLTEGWIPSEIEGVVMDARAAAFEATGKALPSFGAFRECIAYRGQAILSVTARDRLDRLRESCKHALKPDDDTPAPAKPKRARATRGLDIED